MSVPNLSLVDVTPSLLAALGAAEFTDTLGVGGADRVCLLLVDGLGWELLRTYADDAPFLAGLAGHSIESGFPATTAVSIATLGTGLPAGEHGIVGISFQVPGLPLLHALTWRGGTGPGPKDDMRDTAVPERVQPSATVLERAAAAGIAVSVAAPSLQRKSGLTRAALRGAEFHSTYALGDVVTHVREALRPAPSFCYAYHGDLDLLGHVYGPGSDAWRYQLRAIDHLAVELASVLPPGALLAVVADHGMVTLNPDEVFDADTLPVLTDGVAEIGGDIRARHVYASPGAAADVLATWQSVLGSTAVVLSRDEAVSRGWFGPHVSELALPRIGDVVTSALGGGGVVRTRAEHVEAKMTGHHGSHSSAERLVPFLTVRG